MKLGKTKKQVNNKEQGKGKKTYEVLPKGDYVVSLKEVSTKQFSSCGAIEVVWEVSTGTHEKRRIWDRFLFNHSNPKVEEISEEKLAKIFLMLGATEDEIEPLTLEKPEALVEQLKLLAGGKLIVVVDHRDYNGKQYVNVKKYMSM